MKSKQNRLMSEAEKIGRIDYDDAKQKTLAYVAEEFEKYRPHFEDANGIVINFKLQLITPQGIIHNIHPRHFKEYKEWRLAVFTRDEFKCRECNANKNLQAHHINQYAFYPDLRLDIDNGLTLCRDCHKKVPITRRVK